jgi:hypothetical protein
MNSGTTIGEAQLEHESALPVNAAGERIMLAIG